jgi:hypothetical protein
LTEYACVIPHQFLLRIGFPCTYRKAMPLVDADDLLDLPENCRLENLTLMDGGTVFADVRLAWNELGIGFQVEVRGKQQEPQGSAAKPRASDGAALWIDTRDARTSHRATRHCHMFYFLPAGGGPDEDEPVAGQLRIHRALQDAPLCTPSDVLLRAQRQKSGYKLEAFLPAAVLNGYDPDQNRRLGFFYAIRDSELGEQLLGVGPAFPYAEDPSLWSVLELKK